jgi:hypothetical protein
VARHRTNSGRAWRQLIGCIAAYALFLQNVLASLHGVQLAASVMAAGDAPAFEMCLSAESAATSPGGNSHDHGGTAVHCHFCVVACHGAFAAPTASEMGFAAVEAGPQVVVQDDQRRGRAFFRSSNARPRGPPLTA